ncbi:MAG: amidohydrolase family protein [Oscillibacter sp.]|jgi:guanine deaminase|nr:amidohydrolase family protein [Oscillibacter sp.]
MNSRTPFALKGDIVHTPSFAEFTYYEDAYLVCQDARVAGIYRELPGRYRDIPVADHTGSLIIPGMCDMHLHAPQYPFRGLGQNIEKPDWDSWFDQYAFPEEKRYEDLDYAGRAYARLVGDLLQSTTTRACIFATIHRPATEHLMELLHAAGLCAYVGKVNMDRNSAPGLLETTEETLAETRLWLARTAGKYSDVKPILTPRYTPSCTNGAMEGLSSLMDEFRVPVQTHLSEGPDEIAWVRELMPDIRFYGQAYDRYGMMGTRQPALMAHCVFSTPEETEMLCRPNVMIAHCPDANLNYSGTAAPVLRYIRKGARVGLGSDVSGGRTLNLLRIVSEAITASKIHWAYCERTGVPGEKRDVLTLANAFYLATKGGGAFWGDTGSFETGYAFDAVVLDDTRFSDGNPRSVYERIERVISLGDERETKEKYVNGSCVYRRKSG